MMSRFRWRVFARRFRSIRIRVDQYRAWGPDAPREREIVQIDPRTISGYLSAELAHRVRAETGLTSAVVIGGGWDHDVRRFDPRSSDVVTSCRAHWIDGVPWEETAVYRSYVTRIAAGAIPRFRTEEELRVRYDRLDAIYAEVVRTRRLSTRFEHLSRVNVARDGGLVWGPDGRHRLAIALVAGLERVPARIGLVHPDAIASLRAVRANGRQSSSPT